MCIRMQWMSVMSCVCVLHITYINNIMPVAVIACFCVWLHIYLRVQARWLDMYVFSLC